MDMRTDMEKAARRRAQAKRDYARGECERLRAAAALAAAQAAVVKTAMDYHCAVVFQDQHEKMAALHIACADLKKLGG